MTEEKKKGTQNKQIFERLFESNQQKLMNNLRFFTNEQLQSEFYVEMSRNWRLCVDKLLKEAEPKLKNWFSGKAMAK